MVGERKDKRREREDLDRINSFKSNHRCCVSAFSDTGSFGRRIGTNIVVGRSAVDSKIFKTWLRARHDAPPSSGRGMEIFMGELWPHLTKKRTEHLSRTNLHSNTYDLNNCDYHRH